MNVCEPDISTQAQNVTTKIIADFASGALDEYTSAAARYVLRLSLLDWIAVAVSGQDEPVSKIVRDMSCAEAGVPEACIIGSDKKYPVRTAALSNGATSHALDYDDTHFIYLGHPSVAVLPATFAIAEKTGANGRDFLDASLIGVEIACRVGDWMGRNHYQTGFHQTATSGTIGAAAAAARLLGLDEERISHAIGIATTRASGLKSQFGTMGKPYHAGLAASNGVESALLAAAGFVSNPESLECDQGFAATHAGEFNDTALDGIGEKFVFENVQHKFHACCHGTHATLEALIEARDQHKLVPADIASVETRVHPRYLKVCNCKKPTTGLEAKFSFRLTAAMALHGHDTSALSSFNDDVCKLPELVALRDSVFVTTDSNLSESEAHVSITGSSGEKVQTYHDVCAALPIETREAKVRKKATALLGGQHVDASWSAIASLDLPGAPVSLKSLVQH